MTKELLAAYKQLNTDMQTFQNEYAKAMIVMQTASQDVKDLGEQHEKREQTFRQEQEEFETYKETVVESAVQDYIEQAKQQVIVHPGTAEDQNGG